MEQEVLRERERIKDIVSSKIKWLIKEHRIKHVSALERLKDDIEYKIDNP